MAADENRDLRAFLLLASHKQKCTWVNKMNYALYETLKKEWIVKNPTATPMEYTKAMREIAKKAGI